MGSNLVILSLSLISNSKQYSGNSGCLYPSYAFPETNGKLSSTCPLVLSIELALKVIFQKKCEGVGLNNLPNFVPFLFVYFPLHAHIIIPRTFLFQDYE